MKNTPAILTQVAVVVGALALYHLLFHGGAAAPAGDGAAGELQGTALGERQEMDVQLLHAERIFGEAYDESAMRAIVAKGNVELTPEQAAQVLPMLHAHLVGLRRNMQQARAAAMDGKPDAQRMRYRARAAQALGAFSRELSALLSKEQAMGILRAAPSLLPPLPGSKATGQPQPAAAPAAVTTYVPAEPK